MKIDLHNKTHWRDDHIREFLKRGIREERPDLCKRGAPAIIVHIVYTRPDGSKSGYSSGCARVKQNWMKVRLPKNIAPDRIDFAHVIAHELAHTRGMSDEYVMRHSARYGRFGSWRTIYGYAEQLPLDRKDARRSKRPAPDAKATHAASMLRKALTRERRAVTIRKRWERRLAYHTKRVAEAALPTTMPALALPS